MSPLKMHNQFQPSFLTTYHFSVIIGKSHYMLYNLVSAMQPRMLVTFDEQLRPLPTTVRVGQVKIFSGIKMKALFD